jgi:hypothetical protein
VTVAPAPGSMDDPLPRNRAVVKKADSRRGDPVTGPRSDAVYTRPCAADTVEMFRRVLVALLVVAAATACHRDQHDLVVSRLRASAVHAAVLNHGVAESITAVKTTDAKFQAWSGNRISGTGATVWVVEVTGHFTCTYCHDPATGSVGTAMTATYDASGESELASSFGAKMDLAGLGPILTLK